MKFANTEGVVGGLEKGLGEPFSSFRSPQPTELRLRDSVCGITSTALHGVFGRLGYDSRLVMSAPNLAIDPGMEHVFVVVSTGAGEYCVDPTYSQFLRYAGLGLGYVKVFHDNPFPPEKIAIFKAGEHAEIASRLSKIAFRFMMKHPVVRFNEGYNIPPRFRGMNERRMRDTYLDIWDMGNVTEFVPDADVVEVGQAIAAHVDPRDAVLVNS